MKAVGLHSSLAEDGLRVSIRSHAHVLLTELLHLGLDRNALLYMVSVLSNDVVWKSDGCTDKLLAQRHLLELHLVDASLGGAQQHSCGKQSTLHRGQLLGQAEVRKEKKQVKK